MSDTHNDSKERSPFGSAVVRNESQNVGENIWLKDRAVIAENASSRIPNKFRRGLRRYEAIADVKEIGRHAPRGIRHASRQHADIHSFIRINVVLCDIRLERIGAASN